MSYQCIHSSNFCIITSPVLVRLQTNQISKKCMNLNLFFYSDWLLRLPYLFHR